MDNSNTSSNIIFSKSIKSGHRRYYFDVRQKHQSEELYISITESKNGNNSVEANQSEPQKYSRQKINLYKEDFDRFSRCIEECMEFIQMSEEQ